MNSQEKFEQFLEEINQGFLLSGTLSSPLKKANSHIKKIKIRQISLKNQLYYQLSEQIHQQVIHRNLDPAACVIFIKNAFQQFQQGVFTTNSSIYHILINDEQFMSVIKKKTKKVEIRPEHNRIKKYILQEGMPLPFLIALGIMNPEGKIFPKKYDKFRQINRFLEMVQDIVPYLKKKETIKIVDFGCGKAYLTFVLYHYFQFILKQSVEIIGLDLKEEVIKKCQNLANELKFDHLKFIVSDIHQYQLTGNVDLVISLHACDTATDAALIKALNWKADVILCVPCCHHELLNQIKNEALTPLLKHGILKERFSSLVTDAARAELLTIAGYDVQILEFIDMEHTPKNLLIRAIKSKTATKTLNPNEKYDAFKKLLEIHPCFEEHII